MLAHQPAHATREQFKFFYKTVEWLPGMLEQEINAQQWQLATLSRSLVLGPKGRARLA